VLSTGKSPEYRIDNKDVIGSSITCEITDNGNFMGSLTAVSPAPISKASRTAPDAPTAASITAESITLNSIPDCEYSHDGGSTWSDSPAFTSLTPGQTYSFVVRYAETDTHFASPNSESLELTTGTHKFTADVTMSGTARYGETLNVKVTDNNAAYLCIWKCGESILQSGAAEAYTISDPALIGKIITCEIHPDTPQYSGKVVIESEIVRKAENPSIPVAPTIVNITSGSFIVETADGIEYSLDNENWQTDGIFEGLEANKSYSVYARFAEIDVYYASTPSSPALVTTSPNVLSGSIVLGGVKYNSEIAPKITTNNTGTLYYEWSIGDNVIGNSPVYTPTADDIGCEITLTVTSSIESGSISASATVGKADNPTAPKVTAAAESRKGASDGRILGTTAAMEYSKTSDFIEAKPCSKSETTGLKPGTYRVRYAETALFNASAYTTVTVAEGPIPVYSLKVSGGTGSGSYTEGETVTVEFNKSDEHIFDKWTVKGAEIADPTSEKVTFTMPARNVTFIANYFKTEISENIAEVPHALKDNEELDTVQEINEYLYDTINNYDTGFAENSVKIFDVDLLAFTADTAADDNMGFPEDGICVTFPYPNGIDRDTHEFMIVHMFITDAPTHKAGDTEIFTADEIELIEAGLRIRVFSLSPFMMAWKPIDATTDDEDSENENTPVIPPENDENTPDIPSEDDETEAPDDTTGAVHEAGFPEEQLRAVMLYLLANRKVTVTVNATEGGRVVSNSTNTAEAGGDLDFHLIPDFGKRVADVRIGGISIGAVTYVPLENLYYSTSLNVEFTDIDWRDEVNKNTEIDGDTLAVVLCRLMSVETSDCLEWLNSIAICETLSPDTFVDGKLLGDVLAQLSMYLGAETPNVEIPQGRVNGEEFIIIVEEFIAAVNSYIDTL